MKNIFKVHLLLLLYALTLLLAYSTQGILLLEWIISFSLHIVIANSVLLAWAVFLLLGKKKSIKKSNLFRGWVILLVIASIGIGSRVFTFAISSVNSEPSQETVTIAFFNKYYGNSNYEAIDTALERIQPDLIGFTEISKQDISSLRSLQTYQYVVYREASDNFTFGVFSRYPLELLSVEQGEMIHTLVAKVTAEPPYTLVVTHPFAPITPWDIAMRDKELLAIQKYIKSVDNQRVILIGDFNITPWSKMYETFTSGMPKLKNAAQGKGLFLTWGSGLIRAQIDHIFVPKTAFVESFKTEYVQGSDHYLIWSKIGFL